jgi:hypothetical protein
MNALSGYIELEMGGELIPFKFGTNCWALFCENRKIDFNKIKESGVFGKWEDKVMTEPPDLFAMRDLFYAAHVAAMRSKGLPAKINADQFGDLLDETKGAVFKLQEVMLQSKIMGYSFTELSQEGEQGNFQS